MRICVFAGSKVGMRQEYQRMARSLGRELATRKLGLVYGGAYIGLMGIIADAVLAEGGEVIGVTPQGLFEDEGTHRGLTHLYKVRNLYERKALMAKLSDGFIALPGGVGTIEELVEMAAQAHIQLHTKPIGLLNIAEFFTPLQALFTHMITEGFMPSSSSSLLICKDTPSDLLNAMFALDDVKLIAEEGQN